MTALARALLPALALAATAATASPAAAQGVNTQFLVAEIRESTPQCRDFPEYGVVGRVSGVIGGYPTRTVSFVGCFPSFPSCEAWRGSVSGHITGRLILATCAYR
jgi:H+/Cl- antiporter ClcA